MYSIRSCRLFGLLFFLFSAGLHAQTSVGEGTGLWNVADGQGNPFYISLAADKTARTIFGPSVQDSERGVWREEGDGKILVSYTSGWIDVLEPAEGAVRKVAFGPGAPVTGDPSNMSSATRIGPEDFLGNWKLSDEHGDPFYIKVNPDNTATTTYAKSANGFKGESGVWRWEGDQLLLLYTDGWVDILLPYPGGVSTIAYAPGYKIGSAPDHVSQVARASASEAESWSITFESDFKEGVLSDVWSKGLPWSKIVNNEIGAFVPDNVQLKDGVLQLIAEKKEADYGGKTLPYTAGAIHTKGQFAQAYGYFEIRCKVPSGKGLWPSFWLLPENEAAAPEEIVVFDIFGGNPEEVNFLIVTETTDGQTQKLSNGYQGIDFSKDFHNFGVRWLPDGISFYVDGREVAQVNKNIPSAPMYLIVDLAVGGLAGTPNEGTPESSALEVEYVRVFKKDS